jgi:hypothetical protein
MKKIAVVAFLFAVAVTGTFAQTLRNYTSIFLDRNKVMDWKYIDASSDKDFERISALGGDPTDIDTPLEIALLSACAGVIDVRPVEASRMLGTPKQTDLTLGSWVFQEIQILRFLGNTASVGRHEAELKIITDRGNVTRAEVETYYRNGIRTLISETVDEEFNKISGFMIDRNYDAVLTRNSQNGQYDLRYEGAGHVVKELSAASLRALSSVMSRSSDFSATAYNEVEAQAELIPAVVYADRKARGVAGGVDALALIKESITNFYINPTNENYNVLPGIKARFLMNDGLTYGSFNFFANICFQLVLEALSSEIANRASRAMLQGNTPALARYPADPRYDVFSYRAPAQ